MKVYQQLAGFGGGLPVDVLHGVAPHVAPQARKGKGVVVDLLAAGEVAHNLGEGDLDALGGNQPWQHVEVRGLGGGAHVLFRQQQAAHVQARLVNAVVAPPGAAELQGAGDFLPGAQGEHVPAVGVVADGGVGLVGKAQALAHVEVYLHHRQGQELVVDHHLGQGGGVVLGGVFLLEGGLHLQALAPQPVVQDNLKDVQRRQQKEDTKRRHVTWTNLPWAGARTGAAPGPPPSGPGRNPPCR